MLPLSFLEKAASKALKFRDLVCIAAYSTSPTTAYKAARKLDWFKDKAKSCRYLAILLRDYGEEKFEDIVFKRGSVNCESICFCECHLRNWDIDMFLDPEPTYCDCECCEYNECLHAIHSFGEEDDSCPICDSYYENDGEEGDNEYYEDGGEDGYENDGEDIENEKDYESVEEEDESPSSNSTPASRPERIAEKLQKVTGTNYPVKIIQSDNLNGWADENSILITSGSVDSLDDDELAYLISHEISHNRNQHKSQRVQRIKGLLDSMDGTTGLIGWAIVGVLGHGINRSADRTEEYAADEEAKETMQKAGYNPEKAADAVQKIDPQYNNQGGLFSTHPSTSNRIERLKRQP